MEAKLRSIIRPIRWSLLLKALVPAAAWLVLPWWGFLLVSLYCYFVPFFRARELLAPFAAFLFLALAAGPGILRALYAAAVFTLILGIKELVIVNRRTAYGLLVFLLSFAAFLLLFYSFAAWAAPLSFLGLAAAAVLWRWLALADPEREEAPRLPLALAALLLFEAGTVIFFLPVSFFTQAALLFLGSVVLFEAAVNPGRVPLRQLALWSGMYATVALLVVLFAPWKI